MNPVNATALYVSAFRSVLQCDPRDPRSFTDLYKTLPFFRQSLSCLVCGNLLQDPIAPTNSSCQHYVCRGCKGQKMMMKPSCSWCKDYEQFEGNRQLCILVDCYRKLCEYIAGSPLLQHIASDNGGSPDVFAMLKEGLSLSGTDVEDYEVSLSCSSPAPSTSEDPSDGHLEPFAAIQEPPPSSPHGNNINGLRDCNGLTAVEELVVGLPSPPEGDGDAEASLKPGGFTDALQACEPVASDELISDGIEICGFSEDSKNTSGPLMLTVEEVLRSLEPDPEPEPASESCSEAAKPKLETPGNLNGSSVDCPRRPVTTLTSRPPAPSLVLSCSATTPHAGWPSRKRSRSESDSEKVQPLPISSIIQGPPVAIAALAGNRQDVKIQVAQPLATVPNGGTLKVTKTLVTSSRGVKKNPDHIPRKAYSKAKQGVPKTKDKMKDRTSSSNNNGSSGLMSGSPTKAAYKKPQEKKGCKCGRATQNPSVLTCRGQRCPCYSNRKACLDCICRGCQNSYMANGEKKLEAFAVPEKALEQTRLTLGINVTSIAVRSAGTSTGVLSVAAGGPVASFLAGGPHEDKGFNDSLDMNFDC